METRIPDIIRASFSFHLDTVSPYTYGLPQGHNVIPNVHENVANAHTNSRCAWIFSRNIDRSAVDRPHARECASSTVSCPRTFYHSQSTGTAGRTNVWPCEAAAHTPGARFYRKLRSGMASRWGGAAARVYAVPWLTETSHRPCDTWTCTLLHQRDVCIRKTVSK